MIFSIVASWYSWDHLCLGESGLSCAVWRAWEMPPGSSTWGRESQGDTPSPFLPGGPAWQGAELGEQLAGSWLGARRGLEESRGLRPIYRFPRA